jgi:hypothetical protein
MLEQQAKVLQSFFGDLGSSSKEIMLVVSTHIIDA